MFFFFMKSFDSHFKLLSSFESQYKKAKRPGFFTSRPRFKSYSTTYYFSHLWLIIESLSISLYHL